MQATNQTFQRFYNRALVLRQIRNQKKCSRVDLSRHLGLKKSSISNIVSELLTTGIIVEKEQGSSTIAGGRKPIFLELSEKFCGFLGIEIQPNRYSAALIDLNGTRIGTWDGIIHTYNDGFEASVHIAFREIFENLKDIQIPIAGICLGVPGYVNPYSNTILYSVPHGLNNFQIQGLSNPWNAPVFVENDANCCAWGELMHRTSLDQSDYLVVLIEYQEKNPRLEQDIGVSTGFGVVINGNVHYGHSFTAGEFRSLFWKKNHKSQMGIEDHRLLQIQKDEGILEEFLLELLGNLTPLVSVMSPQKVIFCGLGHELIPVMKKIIHEKLPQSFFGFPENQALLIASNNPSHDVASGAAGRLLEVLFQRPSLSGNDKRMGLDWDQIFQLFTISVQ